jgi:hypothetical protein
MAVQRIERAARTDGMHAQEEMRELRAMAESQAVRTEMAERRCADLEARVARRPSHAVCRAAAPPIGRR